jgi:hypothetical protein
MVVREVAVDVAVDHVMLARQPCREDLRHVARRAVARVPHHLQRAVAAIPVAQHACRVVLGDVVLAVVAGGRGRHHVAVPRHPPELDDLRAVERLAGEHHLEAVVVRRVVAAGDHRGAVRLQRVVGEIQHRRRHQPDADHFQPAGPQPGDQLRLQVGRGQAPVIADRHRLAPGPDQHRAEAAADRERILRRERLADDAADVVFAQYGGVEVVAEDGHRRCPSGPELTAGRSTRR